MLIQLQTETLVVLKKYIYGLHVVVFFPTGICQVVDVHVTGNRVQALPVTSTTSL